MLETEMHVIINLLQLVRVLDNLGAVRSAPTHVEKRIIFCLAGTLHYRKILLVHITLTENIVSEISVAGTSMLYITRSMCRHGKI